MGQPGSVSILTLYRQAKAMGLLDERDIKFAGPRDYWEKISNVLPQCLYVFDRPNMKFGWQMKWLKDHTGKPNLVTHETKK